MSLVLLQINVAATNGSNSSIARDIGSLALKKGWTSYIAYGRRALPCESTLIRIGNDLDVKIHGFIARVFDMQGLGSRIATKQFLKKVDKINPDIVHIHNIHGYYLNYKLLFEYFNKNHIPVVWTLHDCWSFTGHCAYFSLINCEKWKTQCEKCPARHSYPKSLFFDRSRNNYNLKKHLFTSLKKLHITTVSKWLQGLVYESFLNKYPVDIVFDGIDTKSFTYRDSNLRKELSLDGKFVLLAVASTWVESKGWKDYIKLSRILPQDIVLVMLGVKETQQLELPDNIIALPRQNSREKLAEYYSMADVLLNLSYQETFGMTTAEAMACGTPGISYNKTACPELISPETGIVVEAGNLDQILSAINVIKTNGKVYYSKACRQRVLDNFDFSKVNLKFFDIYEQMLQDKI